jgi:hypothetical protein
MFEQELHLLGGGVGKVAKQDLLSLVLDEMDTVVHRGIGFFCDLGSRVIGSLSFSKTRSTPAQKARTD